jgi:arginyl-tRNA--protein-N-Asp/Glu arginylyltransferase
MSESCPYPALPPPVHVPLSVIPEHPCPYLPGRRAELRAFVTQSLPTELYHEFMNAAFRRAGELFYQPICRGCRACVPIRVLVADFRPSKSQRRCRRRNADLSCQIGPPTPTDQKFELYRRYLKARHPGPMASDSRAGFEQFLYNSPVQSVELCHRDRRGRLLAVGICDICSRSLSSVYFYFDPAESRRGLGTLGALVEIDLAASLGIEHYYLGYWIAGCRSMEYKSSFRPCQFLHPDGIWRDHPPQ